MAEIVNLNRVRKAKARAAKADEAAENRVKFGRSKAAREQEAEQKVRAKRTLDGKQLDPEPR